MTFFFLKSRIISNLLHLNHKKMKFSSTSQISPKFWPSGSKQNIFYLNNLLLYPFLRSNKSKYLLQNTKLYSAKIIKDIFLSIMQDNNNNNNLIVPYFFRTLQIFINKRNRYVFLIVFFL